MALEIINVGVENFFQISDVRAIDVYIKPSNEASLRLFSRAGFCRAGDKVIDGNSAMHFVLERPEFAAEESIANPSAYLARGSWFTHC